jgi:hypothetical protein
MAVLYITSYWPPNRIPYGEALPTLAVQIHAPSGFKCSQDVTFYYYVPRGTTIIDFVCGTALLSGWESQNGSNLGLYS